MALKIGPKSVASIASAPIMQLIEASHVGWSDPKVYSVVVRTRGVPTLADDEVHQAWVKDPPSPSIPRVAGGPFREWLRAIKGEGPEPGSNFSYSAKLTEIVLLGVLAQRFNTTIEWDAKTGKIVNVPELNAYIKEPVRAGWHYGEALWT
jgi:hypothetical protein